jgi:hypothetical protein
MYGRNTWTGRADKKERYKADRTGTGKVGKTEHA